jgi:hypothetical protein
VRFVDQATLPPHRCAVVPYVGNANALSGFIDTGMELDREHVYISVAEAGTAIARAIGWSPPNVVRALEAENAQLLKRVEELEAEVAEADKFKESIDYIGRGPMKPYKKSGRPKTKVEA